MITSTDEPSGVSSGSRRHTLVSRHGQVRRAAIDRLEDLRVPGYIEGYVRRFWQVRVDSGVSK